MISLPLLSKCQGLIPGSYACQVLPSEVFPQPGILILFRERHLLLTLYYICFMCLFLVCVCVHTYFLLSVPFESKWQTLLFYIIVQYCLKGILFSLKTGYQSHVARDTISSCVFSNDTVLIVLLNVRLRTKHFILSGMFLSSVFAYTIFAAFLILVLFLCYFWFLTYLSSVKTYYCPHIMLPFRACVSSSATVFLPLVSVLRYVSRGRRY